MSKVNQVELKLTPKQMKILEPLFDLVNGDNEGGTALVAQIIDRDVRVVFWPHSYAKRLQEFVKKLRKEMIYKENMY